MNREGMMEILKKSLFCIAQRMHNNLDNLTSDVNWEKTEEYQCMEPLVRTAATLGRGEGERWWGRSCGGKEASGIHITFYALIQVLFHKFVTIIHLKKKKNSHLGNSSNCWRQGSSMGITIREWMMKNRYLIIFKVSYKILLKNLKRY